MGENDLCVGWRPDHYGDAGICCCGLYWAGRMQPHNERGKLIPLHVLDREQRRKGRQLESRLRREEERRELNAIGKPLPGGRNGFRYSFKKVQ